MPVRLQISGPGVGCGWCHENSMSLSAEPTHCIYLFNGLGCFRERGRKFPASERTADPLGCLLSFIAKVQREWATIQRESVVQRSEVRD